MAISDLIKYPLTKEKPTYQEVLGIPILSPSSYPKPSLPVISKSVAKKVYGYGLSLFNLFNRTWTYGQYAFSYPIMKTIVQPLIAKYIQPSVFDKNEANQIAKESIDEVLNKVKREGISSITKQHLTDPFLKRFGKIGNILSWLTASAMDLALNPFAFTGSGIRGLVKSTSLIRMAEEGYIPLRFSGYFRPLEFTDLTPSLIRDAGLLKESAWFKPAQKIFSRVTKGMTEISGMEADNFIKRLLQYTKSQGFEPIAKGWFPRFFGKVVSPFVNVPKAFGFKRGELLTELLNQVGLLKSNFAKPLLDSFLTFNYTRALERGEGILRITKNHKIILVPSAKKLKEIFFEVLQNSKGLTPDEFWLNFAKYLNLQSQLERVTKGASTLERALRFVETDEFNKLKEINSELAEKVKEAGYNVVKAPEHFKTIANIQGQILGKGYTEVSKFIDEKMSALLDYLVRTREIPSNWQQVFRKIPRPPIPLETWIPRTEMANFLSLIIPGLSHEDQVIYGRHMVRAAENVSNLINNEGRKLTNDEVWKIFNDSVFGLKGQIKTSLGAWNERIKNASTATSKLVAEWNVPTLRLMDLPISVYDNVAASFGLSGKELCFAIKSALANQFPKESLLGISAFGGWLRSKVAAIDYAAKARIWGRWQVNPVFRAVQYLENQALTWFEKGLAKEELPKTLKNFLVRKTKENYALRQIYGDIAPVFTYMKYDEKMIENVMPHLVKKYLNQYLKVHPKAKLKNWQELVEVFRKIDMAEVDAHIVSQAERGVYLTLLEGISDLHPELSPYINILSRAKEEAIETLENAVMFSRVRTGLERDINYVFFPFSYTLRVFRYLVKRADLPFWQKGTAALFRAGKIVSDSIKQNFGITAQEFKSRYPTLNLLLDYAIPFSAYGDFGVGIEPLVRLVLSWVGIKLPAVAYTDENGFEWELTPVGRPRGLIYAYMPSLGWADRIEYGLKQLFKPPKGYKPVPRGWIKVPVPPDEIETINNILRAHPYWTEKIPLTPYEEITRERVGIKKRIRKAEKKEKKRLKRIRTSKKLLKKAIAREVEEKLGKPRPLIRPKSLDKILEEGMK